MDFTKTNKTLLPLVLLLLCINLFDSAQAICVVRTATAPLIDSFGKSSSSSLSSSSSSSQSESKSQPSSASSTTPPSSPPPSSSSGSPPPSTPTPSSGSGAPETTKLLQVSLPTVSLDIGLAKPNPQIVGLCDKTDFPPLCVSSVLPFFNGKTDVFSVIEMVIKSGTDQTKQAMAHVEKMLADPKCDAKAKARYDDCKEVYDDALDNMQSATDAIPKKDVGTIATMISATISDFGTCDDGFTGQPDPESKGVSPMAKINENLINISAIILALSELIK